MCVDGMNLKCVLCWHIHISVHSVLCQCYTHKHTHTRIFKPFEDSELTGLKMDTAHKPNTDHSPAHFHIYPTKQHLPHQTCVAKLTLSLTPSCSSDSSRMVFISRLLLKPHVTWNAVLHVFTEHWMQAPTRSLHKQQINAQRLG